jgi:hypothetical protein
VHGGDVAPHLADDPANGAQTEHLNSVAGGYGAKKGVET